MTTVTSEPPVTASVRRIDFGKKGAQQRQHASGKTRHLGNSKDLRPVNGEGKLLTPKQIRARARRAAKRSRSNSAVTPMSELEFEHLYKPIEDWDLEELAMGKPRNKNGNFMGKKPGWITREVHERAMELFQTQTKSELGALVPSALDAIRYILNNEEKDEKGKFIIPPAARLQATHLIIEHAIGKPKQHVQQDISIKLQGLLGMAMVNPSDAITPTEQGGGGFQLAHFPGQTIAMGELGEAPPDDDDEDLGGFGE